MSELILWCNGDPSVGIPGSDTTIDLCFILDKDDRQMREEIAKTFVDIFRDLWDCSTIHYHYDDECPECGLFVNEEGKCVNDKCYNNL